MKQAKFKTDIEALLKVKKGDQDAFRFLFDSYFADLCKFLQMYLSDPFVSEEIALDLFSNLWEKRDNLKIESSFKGYLFQSAKYKAISHLRKKRKEIYMELDVQELQENVKENNPSHVEIDELREIIKDAINRLPEKSRMIYQMAREENLSHKQIAEKLGLTPKTVENHVGIALRKLRASLKPYYEQIFILCLVHF
ncbi:RNA polymerase sigma-70 factor [Puteibacter caeruleilacunae]|nr:RNA polymerase sigma-70 factor [Puteibacter caeruleilacunae]